MKQKIQLDHDKYYEYDSKQIGAIIQAPTGMGKTRLISYLILSVAKMGATVYFIDGKRSDLYSLRYAFPEEIREKHVASTPSQASRLLRELVEKMNYRYEKYFSNESSAVGENYTTYNLRPIFLFFDELLAVMGEDKKIAKEIENHLLQIILKGRQAGVFAVLSSQRFSADVLNTTIRENLGMRVALGRMSKDSYRMVFGDFYDELPIAEKGIGKGYIYLDGLGWSTPRAFITPIFDTSKINVREILTRYIADGIEKYGLISD